VVLITKPTRGGRSSSDSQFSQLRLASAAAPLTAICSLPAQLAQGLHHTRLERCRTDNAPEQWLSLRHARRVPPVSARGTAPPLLQGTAAAAGARHAPAQGPPPRTSGLSLYGSDSKKMEVALIFLPLAV